MAFLSNNILDYFQYISSFTENRNNLKYAENIRIPVLHPASCHPPLITIASTPRFNELQNLKLKHSCRLVTCTLLFLSRATQKGVLCRRSSGSSRMEIGTDPGQWQPEVFHCVAGWLFPFNSLRCSCSSYIYFYCFCTHLPIKWRERTFSGRARVGKIKGGQGEEKGATFLHPPAQCPSFQFVCSVSTPAPQLAVSAFLRLIISVITFSL